MGKFPTEKVDQYYRKAKVLGYRARSAFKLLHVDEQFHICDGVSRAVDLCAAPGSWSQVLSRRLAKNSIEMKSSTDPQIVAVDLQEMAPIKGVKLFCGDITKQETVDAICDSLKGKAQLVVCDGAPDVTGLHQLDAYVHAQLLLAALKITTMVLEQGGSFCAKIFKDESYPLLESQLRVFFGYVHCVKPLSSRARSAEHFVVCQDFDPLAGYKTSMTPSPPKLLSSSMTTQEYSTTAIEMYLKTGNLSAADGLSGKNTNEVSPGKKSRKKKRKSKKITSQKKQLVPEVQVYSNYARFLI